MHRAPDRCWFFHTGRVYEMKVLMLILGSVLMALIVLWIFTPTSVSAAQIAFEHLPKNEFSDIRSEAIAFERANPIEGVALNEGDMGSQSIQFTCKGVPVLTVVNWSEALVLMEHIDASRRAPGVQAFGERLHSRLKSTRRILSESPVADHMGWLGTFVMKHRDGLDLSTECHERASGTIRSP